MSNLLPLREPERCEAEAAARAEIVSWPAGRRAAPFGEAIVIWWNFVARTVDEIREGREDWQAGRRFGEVRAYRGQRLRAPELVGRPRASR